MGFFRSSCVIRVECWLPTLQGMGCHFPVNYFDSTTKLWFSFQSFIWSYKSFSGDSQLPYSLTVQPQLCTLLPRVGSSSNQSVYRQTIRLPSFITESATAYLCCRAQLLRVIAGLRSSLIRAFLHFVLQLANCPFRRVLHFAQKRSLSLFRLVTSIREFRIFCIVISGSQHSVNKQMPLPWKTANPSKERITITTLVESHPQIPTSSKSTQKQQGISIRYAKSHHTDAEHYIQCQVYPDWNHTDKTRTVSTAAFPKMKQSQGSGEERQDSNCVNWNMPENEAVTGIRRGKIAELTHHWRSSKPAPYSVLLAVWYSNRLTRYSVLIASSDRINKVQ